MSIIVPLLNRLDLTEKCVASIYEHTKDFELVLVDNGSEDDTWDWVSGIDAVRISVEPNLGFAKGANIGGVAASGDVVVFLNNDTEVRPGWLKPLVAVLGDGVGAAAGRLENPDGSLQHAGVQFYYDTGDVLVAENIRTEQPAGEAQCVAGAAVALTREAFRAVGGWDDAFYNGYEDVDLCLRLRDAGYKVWFTPDSTVMHHCHASGSSRWAKVRENVALLNERWHGKVEV